MSVLRPIVVDPGKVLVPVTNQGLMQPTTVRLISPSQVIATTKQPPTSEDKFLPKEDSATQLIKDQQKASRTRLERAYDWLFQKDFLKIYNLIWVLAAATLALAIAAIAICITVVYCRQENVDVTATTQQSGRFVSEACTLSSQCLENAQCYTNRCQCVPDFYYSEDMGQCLPVKTYGDPCTDSRECDTSAYLGCYRRIYESQCLCPYGFFWGNYYGSYECLTYRAIGQVCQSTSDCLPTSYCAFTGNDYRCLCPSGQYVDSGTGQCTLLKQYNEPCNFYYQECDSNYLCRGTVGAPNTHFCLCRSDYYFNGTSHSCLPTSTINGWCFNITHCNPFTDLLCLNGTCQCSHTQYWNGTHCVDYLLYGQACSSQSQCNPYDANLLCRVPLLGTVQTICYCRDEYYFDEYNSQCAKIKHPNQNCTFSYECIENSVCQLQSVYQESSVCTCVPGYYYSDVTEACEPMGSYLDTCTTNTITDESECNDLVGLYCNSAGQCVCRPDHYWNSPIGFCQLTVIHGEACSAAPDSCRSSRNLACTGAGSTCACTAANPTYNNDFRACV